jgi:hypothetical protein
MPSAITVLLYAGLIVDLPTLLSIGELFSLSSNHGPLATVLSADLSKVVFYDPIYFWCNRKLYLNLVPWGRSCFGTSPNPRLRPDSPKPAEKITSGCEKEKEVSHTAQRFNEAERPLPLS